MLCEVRLLLTPTLVWFITICPVTLGGVSLNQRQWSKLQGQRRPRHHQAVLCGLPAEAVPIPTGPVHRNGLSPFSRYPGEGVHDKVQGLRGLNAAHDQSPAVAVRSVVVADAYPRMAYHHASRYPGEGAFATKTVANTAGAAKTTTPQGTP
jgi:hypothetical protein